MNLKKMIKALIKVYSDRSQFDVSLAQSPLEEGLWFRIFKKIFIYLFILKNANMQIYMLYLSLKYKYFKYKY